MDSAGKNEGDALADRWLAYLLGHPLRARIAAEVNTSYRESAELAETLGEPLLRVKYHCRVLALASCRTGADGKRGA